MATPAEISTSEESINLVEEWIYSNTFLADLEEAFTRWRLVEASLPAGDQLKLFLQNSLQATGKLKSMYISFEDKRPDMESQLRSWVTKVEAQILESSKLPLTHKKWPVLKGEPKVFVGPSVAPNRKTTETKADEILLTTSQGNIFAMEDWFGTEKSIEMLMMSASPQQQLQQQAQPTQTNSATLSSKPGSSTSTSSTAGVVGTSVAISTATMGSPSTGQRASGGGHHRNSSSSSTDTNSSSSATTSTNPSAPSSPRTSLTHIIVEINDLIMIVGQESVLSLSLYSEDRFITEEFCIALPNSSPIVLEEKSKRVLFRDIPTDAVKSNLWLIAKVIRLGKIKFSDGKNTSKESTEGYPVRRPYAMAAISISSCLTQAENEKELAEALQNSAHGVAAAKAATLRRRQFSNAPRPVEHGSEGSSGNGRPSAAAAVLPLKHLRNSAKASAISGGSGHHASNSNTHDPFHAASSDDTSKRAAAEKAMNFLQSENEFMTLYAPTRDEIFPDMHSYIINDIRDRSSYLTFLPKAKGLLVTIKRFEGSWSQLQHNSLFINSLPISICQLMHMSDQGTGSVETSAPRNDLYVTIEEAQIADGKTMEILVEARNKSGAPASLAASVSSNPNSNSNTSSPSLHSSIPHLITQRSFSLLEVKLPILPCPIMPLYSQTLSAPPSIVHRTIPYYHKKEWKPQETFKIDLSRFVDIDHLLLTVRHVSESGKTNDISFSTLKLYQQDSTFITNGVRKVPGYKPTSPSGSSSSIIDTKKGFAGSAFRATVQGGQAATGTGSNNSSGDGNIAWYLKSEDSLVRSNKSDFISLNVNLVSTKITENIPLRVLLNWQNSTDPDMAPLLEKCSQLSRKDIINFYKDIFDTLMDMIVLLDDVRTSAFYTLMSILSTCQSDPMNVHYDEMDSQSHLSLKHWVDRYLEDSFTNTKVYPLLMDTLFKVIHSSATEAKSALEAKYLKGVVKGCPLLVKFIMRSRHLALTPSSLASTGNPLVDYSSGSIPRIKGGNETVSSGVMPAGGMKIGKAANVKPSIAPSKIESGSNSNIAASSANFSPTDVFLSHGFTPDVAESKFGLSQAESQTQIFHNPLFLKSTLKNQPLYSNLAKDTAFRKKYLTLIDSFYHLLSHADASFIQVQTLMVKALPGILQNSVHLLDKDQTSRLLERFLEFIDDGHHAQLNVEKLLLLERFQFSPYVNMSIQVKHIRQHIHNSTEERFISARIAKSMVRSLTFQYFHREINFASPVAIIQSHPDDELESSYTSASTLTNSIQTPSSTAGTGSPILKVHATVSAATGITPDGTSSAKKRVTLKERHTTTDPKNSTNSGSTSTGSASQSAPAPSYSLVIQTDTEYPSIPLYLVLLDLVNPLVKIMVKADENDFDTRRDICSTFLAILGIISLKVLKNYLMAPKSVVGRWAKHQSKSFWALASLCFQLVKSPTYPLGWPDLILYMIKKITRLSSLVLIPTIVKNNWLDTKKLSDREVQNFTNLFCSSCYLMRHPALQLEYYVANKHGIVSFLGGKDLRTTHARILWTLWQRFEPLRFLLVPEAIPALLSLSNSPNQVCMKISHYCYMQLVGREVQIRSWMDSAHKSVNKIYQTVTPIRPLSSKNNSSINNNNNMDGGTGKGLNSSSAGGANNNGNPARSSSIPVRMLPSPPLSGDNTSTNSTDSTNSTKAASQDIPTETGRARSNNATGVQAPRPAIPKGSPVKRMIGSGSSSNIIPSSNSTTSRSTNDRIISNPPSTSSPNLSRLSGSSTDIEGYSSMMTGMHHSGSTSSFSFSGVSFPRIEVGSIQALEEMSKSGAWNQKNLEFFFLATKELSASIPDQTSNLGPNSSSSSSGIVLKPSASSENIDAIKRYNSSLSQRSGSIGDSASNMSLYLNEQTQDLPQSLKDTLNESAGQRSSKSINSLEHNSILSVISDFPTLKSRLSDFVNDMLSLVLLLASLRDLPRGSEYDEERAYALTQLMTYLRQTKHADAYFKYAFQLSRMYEEAGQYTEAAFAVLLHAEMLEWSERILPETQTSPSMPSSKRKQQLITQAIHLFDKGKAWEDAIRVSSEYVLALKNNLFDYHSLASQLRLQADLYLKIADQDRFFSNYFYVAYYGTGFPNALRRKCFIYRGLELERIPHFISRMEKKFPNAQVLKTMDPPSSDLTDKNKERSGQYLQIFTVQPSSEDEMNGLRKDPAWLVPNMPEGARKYHAANNVRVFQYSRPFKMAPPASQKPSSSSSNPDNAFVDLWTAQVFLVTEDTFPNIQRRLEIKTISEIIRNPVENATVAIEMKNSELSELMIKNPNNDMKIDRLSRPLAGILDAAVNGGTAKYQEAFLSKAFFNESKGDPKTLEGIKSLQKALLEQLSIVNQALNLHGELVPSNLVGFHKRLESQYEAMVKQITASVTASGGAALLQSRNLELLSHQNQPNQNFVQPPSHHAPQHSQSGPPGSTPSTTAPLAKATSAMGSSSPTGLGPVRMKQDVDLRPSVIGIAAAMMTKED